MNEMTYNADTVFTALSHPMRLRTLVLIKQMNELCVCELTHTLGLAQPVISRHLALLKEAKLVTSRRQGIWIYYSVNSELPDWIHKLINITTDGIAKTSPYQDDLASLNAMTDRPNNNCCN